MERQTERCGTLHQVVMASVVSMTTLSGGMTVAYPSIALPAMQLSNFTLTVEEESWIASLPQLTMILGALGVGPLLDNYGRKLAILSASLSSLIGWLVIAWAERIWTVYIGRLLTGLGAGLGSAAAAVLLAELSVPGIRGALTNARNVSFSVGLTFVYALGMSFKGRVLSLLSNGRGKVHKHTLLYQREWGMVGMICGLGPGLSGLLTLLLVPESQVWVHSTANNSSKVTWSTFVSAATSRREIHRPLILMNALFFLRQMSGTSVILSYSVSMVQAARVPGDPYLASVLLGAGRAVAGIVAGWASRRLGRRIPVTYSGVLMCLSLFGLSRLGDPAPAPLLALFVISSTIFSAVPQAMIGEIYPSDFRGMGSAASTCVSFASSFLALKIYPGLKSNLNRQGLFAFYAVISAVATLWAILFLPETQGKTFQEISLIFDPNAKALGVEEQESMVPLRDLGEDKRVPLSDEANRKDDHSNTVDK